MDGLNNFFQMLLGFLLQLLELFVGFWIAVLNLVLDFARSLAGLVS